MLARLPHRFSLDPLIAEAKRRARQRRLLVLLVLALGGAAAAVVVGLAADRAGDSTAAQYEPGYLGMPVSLPFRLESPASLSDVSSAASGGAWIVGSVAWHWDGDAWRSVPLPKPNGTELQSVATISADDAWAVGWRMADEEVHSRGLIEHWDGSRWSAVHEPVLRGVTLSSVSAAGSRDVWASGSSFHSKSDRRAARKGRPLLLHWDGTAWRLPALPWAHSGMEIEKVVATAGAGVWAVVREAGRDTETVHAAYWSGERWHFVPQPFGPQDPLTGFDATAWNDAWAVGSYRAGSSSRSLSAHWDGHAWRVLSVPEVSGYNASELSDVSAVGPTDAFAVGLTNRSGSTAHGGWVSTPVPVFFHWDGNSWQLMPGVAPSLSWSGPSIAAGRRGGSAWAIGNCGSDNVVFRWTRGRWRVVPHPRDVSWPHGVPASIRRHKPSTCAAHG